MAKPKDIRAAVKAELDFDPLIDDADITVKNLEVRSFEESADATNPVQRALDRYGLFGDDSDITVNANQARGTNVATIM